MAAGLPPAWEPYLPGALPPTRELTLAGVVMPAGVLTPAGVLKAAGVPKPPGALPLPERTGTLAWREVTEEKRPTARTVPRGRGMAAGAAVRDVVFTNPVSIKKILCDQIFSINLLNKLVLQINFSSPCWKAEVLA